MNKLVIGVFLYLVILSAIFIIDGVYDVTEKEVRCIAGFEYIVEKESGKLITIILKNDLPVECKDAKFNE